MKKILKNEQGMALVIVMLLSLIGLMIVSSLLFMITIGTRTSGQHRFFRSADDAGLGGSEISVEFVKNLGYLPGAWTTLTGNAACLQQKLTLSRGDWTTTNWTNCNTNEMSLDAATNPDLFFTLPGPAGRVFNISSKIVDTVTGNSDRSGLIMGGNLSLGGVDNSNTGLVNPPHHPYVYRIEVQAEDPTNTFVRTRYSVLYAY